MITAKEAREKSKAAQQSRKYVDEFLLAIEASIRAAMERGESSVNISCDMYPRWVVTMAEVELQQAGFTAWRDSYPHIVSNFRVEWWNA